MVHASLEPATSLCTLVGGHLVAALVQIYTMPMPDTNSSMLGSHASKMSLYFGFIWFALQDCNISLCIMPGTNSSLWGFWRATLVDAMFRFQAMPKVVKNVLQVLGRFRWEEECAWSVLFGQNKMGRMEDKLSKYIFNSIVPLFPHVKDKLGYRVFLKVSPIPYMCRRRWIRTLGMVPSRPNF